jgi:hypothetical protein
MPTDSFAFFRDAIVLAYMLLLRIVVPLLCIVLVGKWIQAKMAEADRREQLARQGEPYCWDIESNPQTERARAAAAAHPDLPCWLAVQCAGGGVTDACFNCPRYAVRSKHALNGTLEVG